MRHFTELSDIPNLKALVELADSCSQMPHEWSEIGRHKSIGFLFLNPSLRTRLSSQLAAENLGLRATVVDATQGWKLELEPDQIMNTDKAEHIIEAAGVIGAYFDIIGFRSFPSLTNKEADYSEVLMNRLKEHCKRPVISLESATGHPLQSLADLLTIKQFATNARPKVVMTWAPHPRALPQAVPNTFAQFALAAGHDLTIAHPPSVDLSDDFTQGATITHDQDEALKDADFVYVKNWSSYSNYGQPEQGCHDWMITAKKLAQTNEAKVMHCLPVRRNVVIDQEVLDSKQSIVIEQAKNRIYAAQAVIKSILDNL